MRKIIEMRMIFMFKRIEKRIGEMKKKCHDESEEAYQPILDKEDMDKITKPKKSVKSQQVEQY